MSEIIAGYHFVGKTLRNGQPIPPDGEWLVHEGTIVPCESGLHVSEHPYDALRYAPGATLCLVELEGDLQSHGDPVDKWVGRRRRILVRIGADALLRRFAADEALRVAHLWRMPASVREYLTTLDESKREASRADSYAAGCAADWTASLTVSYSFSRAASYMAGYAASCAASYAVSYAVSYAASCAASYAFSRASSCAACRADSYAFSRTVSCAACRADSYAFGMVGRENFKRQVEEAFAAARGAL